MPDAIHRRSATVHIAAPEDGGPLGSPGLVARGLPFVVLTFALLGISSLGAGEFNFALAITAALLCAGVFVAAWLIPWTSIDTRWQAVVPLAIIAINPLMREASGGSISGASVLLLPILWLALYHGRWAITLGLVGVICNYVLPPQMFSESYPDFELEMRRAVTALLLFGPMSFIVQRLISQLRSARTKLAYAYQEANETNERLTELDRLKSRFVAIASHELRTPLTTITGFSKTLVERWDLFSDEQKRTFIQMIDEQGERLAYLVNDLLVLSKIQASIVESHTTAFHVSEAIERVVHSLETSEEIRVQCPSDLIVQADESHVQRILLNYLTNAQKYGRGPIEVHATTHTDAWVEIRVKDHGDGVEAAFVEHLFEEFERAEQHEVAGIPGTGLGLSIVQGLAAAQGGTTWYEDNVPAGAVFGIRLPAGSVSA